MVPATKKSESETLNELAAHARPFVLGVNDSTQAFPVFVSVAGEEVGDRRTRKTERRKNNMRRTRKR